MLQGSYSWLGSDSTPTRGTINGIPTTANAGLMIIQQAEKATTKRSKKCNIGSGILMSRKIVYIIIPKVKISNPPQ
ncbi:MAG: hypothetical protein WAV41_02615 [Microgenomates group bacterium]